MQIKLYKTYKHYAFVNSYNSNSNSNSNSKSNNTMLVLLACTDNQRFWLAVAAHNFSLNALTVKRV